MTHPKQKANFRYLCGVCVHNDSMRLWRTFTRRAFAKYSRNLKSFGRGICALSRLQSRQIQASRIRKRELKFRIFQCFFLAVCQCENYPLCRRFIFRLFCLIIKAFFIQVLLSLILFSSAFWGFFCG